MLCYFIYPRGQSKSVSGICMWAGEGGPMSYSLGPSLLPLPALASCLGTWGGRHGVFLLVQSLLLT